MSVTTAADDPARDDEQLAEVREPERPRAPLWRLLLVLPGVLAFAALVEFVILRLAMDEGAWRLHVSSGLAVQTYVVDVFFWCLVLGALVFLTGRFWASAAVFTMFGALVAYANSTKLGVRLEPIYPSDITTVKGEAGFLAEMVGTSVLVKAALGLVALAVVFWGAARLMRRWLPRVRRRDDPRRWGVVLVVRLACFAVCAALLAHAASFNTAGNYWRRAYDAMGSDYTAAGNQKWTYNRNGFVGGFLYNLNGPVMAKPAGYSREAVEAVVAKYEARAAAINAGRDPAVLDGLNIVLVLSETFTDPLRINGLEVAEDPIPITRKFLETTYSGLMLAQKVGSGTANMEFELLTGLSLSQFDPRVDSPYQKVIPYADRLPSSVELMKQLGHERVAIHPYSGNFYKRRVVYPRLGFTDFVDIDQLVFKDRVRNGRYVSDESAYKEIEHRIAESRDPMLVQMVTMQNHYPWTGQFEDPIAVKGVPPQWVDDASRYMRGLAWTDQFTDDWRRRMLASDEKTAVIWYGDHLPGRWPLSLAPQNGERRMRETPYFIWTNFQQLPHRQVPTTSPIYFLPTLFDELKAPLPPMYALLRDLQKQLPAMHRSHYVDARDQWIKPGEASPEAKALLADYRMLQYDLVAGKQYSADRLYQTP